MKKLDAEEFEQAAFYGDTKKLREILKKNRYAPIRCPNALINAASQNHPAAVKLILEAHSERTDNFRAVCEAAGRGHNTVLQVFFNNGLRQDELDLALLSAQKNQKTETAELLVTNGADPKRWENESPSQEGKAAIRSALSAKGPEKVGAGTLKISESIGDPSGPTPPTDPLKIAKALSENPESTDNYKRGIALIREGLRLIESDRDDKSEMDRG